MTLNLDPTIDAVSAELRRVIIDATAALEVAPAAIRRMSDAQAGYPTAPSTGTTATMPTPAPHGATGWACPAKGCPATSDATTRSFVAHWQDEHTPDPSTQPERWAAVTGDEAGRDVAQLIRALRTAASSTIAARRALEKYGTTKHGHATVADPINDKGCTSCAQDMRYSERRPGKTQCGWCAKKLGAINGIRAEHDLAPLTLLPLPMVRKHHQGRDVTTADVEHWARTDEPIRPRTSKRRAQRQATRDLRAGR